MKKVIMIAGPNGAGKTTFAEEFLPNEAGCLEFVNADLIAAGLSPFRPERVALAAGRLMLERIRELFKAGESFAFETTLATRGYARQIRDWNAAGYQVKLYFLRLPDAGFAVRRVENRVRMGGHAIPADVVRRRFLRGLENLRERYLGVVDEWSIYDASESPVRLIETGGKARPPRIMDDPGSYSSGDEPAKRVEPLDDPDFIGAEAAFARASAKAIAMTRAAGLEPVLSNGGDDVGPADE